MFVQGWHQIWVAPDGSCGFLDALAAVTSTAASLGTNCCFTVGGAVLDRHQLGVAARYHDAALLRQGLLAMGFLVSDVQGLLAMDCQAREMQLGRFVSLHARDETRWLQLSRDAECKALAASPRTAAAWKDFCFALRVSVMVLDADWL